MSEAFLADALNSQHELIALDPGNPDNHERYADLLIKSREKVKSAIDIDGEARKYYEQAEDLYKQKLAQSTDNAELFQRLGSCMLKHRRLDEKISYDNIEEHFRRAVELAPDNLFHVRKLHMIVKLQNDLKSYDVSIAKILAQSAKDTEDAENTERKLEEKQLYEKTKSLYEKALKADPRNVKLWVDYGLFLSKEDNLRKKECFLQAFHLNPLCYLHSYVLGMHFLHEEENLDEAEKYFRIYYKLNPSNKDVFDKLCLILYKTDQLDELLSLCIQNLQTKTPHVKKCIDWCNLILSQKSQSVKTEDLRTLGKISYSIGEYEFAQKIYMELVKHHPKKLGDFLGLCDALEQQKKFREALQVITTIDTEIELDEKSKTALKERAIAIIHKLFG